MINLRIRKVKINTYSFLLALFALFFSFTVAAEEWGFLLNRSGDNKPIEVDWSSVKNDKGLTFIDIRYSPVAGLKSLFGDVSMYKESIVVDCHASSYASSSITSLLKNGSTRIERVTSFPDLSFIKPSRFSNEGKVLEKLCVAINKTLLDKQPQPLQEIKAKTSQILSEDLSKYYWRYVGQSDVDSSQIHIDPKSIQRVNISVIGVVIKQDFRENKKTLSGFEYNQAVSQIFIDCNSNTVIFTGYDFYNSKNNLVDNFYMESSEWKENSIPEQSLLSLVNNTSCPIGLSKDFSVENEDKKNSSSNAISTGTAWLINSNHLITAAHVINNSKNIKAVINETLIDISVVDTDEVNDVAILRLNKPITSKPLNISNQNVRLGTDIVVIGYPLSTVLGNKIQVTSGVVSATGGIANDKRVLQITAPIQPGNSGGPLLNTYGEVVGLVTSKLSDKAMIEQGFVPQNVNFSLKVPYFKALLDSNEIHYTTQNKQMKKTISKLVEEIESSVFLIIVETSDR